MTRGDKRLYSKWNWRASSGNLIFAASDRNIPSSFEDVVNLSEHLHNAQDATVAGTSTVPSSQFLGERRHVPSRRSLRFELRVATTAAQPCQRQLF